QILRLSITPKTMPLVGGKPPPAPAALDRTVLAVHSPVARFAPGTLVRVSAWVRIDEPIKATADGALFFDTAGGEPLAVRLTDSTATQRPDKSVNKWRRYYLYRRVPASGQIQVTLALTGLGTVYFDDVKIEPLTPGPATSSVTASAGGVAGDGR